MHKEIYKKCYDTVTLSTQKSLLGVSLSLSHTHTGLPWRFILNLPTSIPVTFISESPAPGGRAWIHVRGFKTVKSKFLYAKEFQQFLVQMPDFPLVGKLNKKSCLNEQTCILVNRMGVMQFQRVNPQVKAVLLIGAQVWKGIFGIRDLTQIRCGTLDNASYIIC